MKEVWPALSSRHAVAMILPAACTCSSPQIPMAPPVAVAGMASLGAASTRASEHPQHLRQRFRIDTAAMGIARPQLPLAQERLSKADPAILTLLKLAAEQRIWTTVCNIG